MSAEKVSIGKRVALARKTMGMRQEDLARETGYSRAWVAEVEQGRIELRPEVIMKIARATGKTVAWLLDEPQEIARGDPPDWAQAILVATQRLTEMVERCDQTMQAIQGELTEQRRERLQGSGGVVEGGARVCGGEGR